MIYKKIEYTGIQQLLDPSKDKVLSAAWKSSLWHQVPGGKLPEFEKVNEELIIMLEKILV